VNTLATLVSINLFATSKTSEKTSHIHGFKKKKTTPNKYTIFSSNATIQAFYQIACEQ
jgi:hypothetical protein